MSDRWEALNGQNSIDTNTIHAFYRNLGAIWMPTSDSFSTDLGIEINFSRGLNARHAEYAVWKFKLHRQVVGMQIMMDIGILDNTA